MTINTCKRCNKEFVGRKAKACSSACRNWLYVQTRLPEVQKMIRESYHRRKHDPLNIKKSLLKYAKSRALKRKIDFTITEEDLILPEICPIFKQPLNRFTRKFSYSLDRIDPSKGYIKGNVQIISQLANAMKWDSTREERLIFANWVLSSEGG